MSAPRVPVKWRRTFAITTYLYARAGEVCALRWEDIDLERGVVHIHHGRDRDTGALKPTKTGRGRRLPIEPALLTLLHAMRKESGGEGFVVPGRAMDRKFARQLRRCLRLAGVTRAELFVKGDPT